MGAKYSPSLLATSPTDTQSGTSGCRCMMARTASNAPWMSPSAPICIACDGHCSQCTRPIRSMYIMPGQPSLSAEQLLLATLVFKLAVMAASATILVRFRRFRHFLISEDRPGRERLTFALSLGILLSAGVAARLLLKYQAADLT